MCVCVCVCFYFIIRRFHRSISSESPFLYCMAFTNCHRKKYAKSLWFWTKQQQEKCFQIFPQYTHSVATWYIHLIANRIHWLQRDFSLSLYVLFILFVCHNLKHSPDLEKRYHIKLELVCWTQGWIYQFHDLFFFLFFFFLSFASIFWHLLFFFNVARIPWRIQTLFVVSLALLHFIRIHIYKYEMIGREIV